MVAEKRKSVVEHPPTLLGGTAIRPKERSFGEAFRYTIYNPETGEFFTRTPKSWFLITLFYCIYYTCLAAFWYGMLNILLHLVPDDRPMWTQDDGIIGSNPGLGMRPKQPDVTIDSSMLKLKGIAADETPSIDFESASNIDWAKRYETYLKTYQNATQTEDCSSGKPTNVENGEASCRFDTTVLGKCNDFPYGYQSVGTQRIQPCVLLKMNRIYGWEPQGDYTAEELKEAVNNKDDPMPEKIRDAFADASAPKRVYFDCDGENPADIEALRINGVNSMEYFPSHQGISVDYLPYEHANVNYHTPLVAIRFNGDNIPAGQLVHVQCKLWAKGITHNKKDRLGLVRFELLIE